MAATGGSHSPAAGDRRLIPPLRILAPLALALLLAGCGSNENGSGAPLRDPTLARLTPAERDSAALVDEERAGAHRDSVLAAEVRPMLADWEEAWTRVIPGFQLDSLRWQKRDTLVTGNARTAAEHLVTNDPLESSALDSLTQRRWKLVFTPDRWIAVDPDFERFFFPDGRLGARVPARVSVYDFRARRKLILDQAPSSWNPFEVTGWTGERRLVVAGWQPWRSDSDSGSVRRIRPTVWIYDLDALHRTAGMGPPVSEPELEAHKAMLELLIRQRNAPARRR